MNRSEEPDVHKSSDQSKNANRRTVSSRIALFQSGAARQVLFQKFEQSVDDVGRRAVFTLLQLHVYAAAYRFEVIAILLGEQ